MIEKLRLYISDCVDPYKNLATEKYLFDKTPEDCCTLYLWQNQRTVVIGRNQNPWAECQCSVLKSDGGKLARRLSGGGAVFHDLGNLNFTFLCSTKNYDLTKQMQVIQKACALAGVYTELSGRNDILANGKKFSGNAFYNSNGKSYHHGTLLINADMQNMQRYLTPPKAKLEAKGVKSVKSRVVNLSQLSPGLTCQSMIEHMISAFENVYNMQAVLWENIDFDEILPLARHYGSWDYLYGTPPPFSFTCEGRFTWGHIQLHLQISKGVIEYVKVYTDALEWELPELINTALSGCRFEITKMTDAIKNTLPNYLADDLVNLLKSQEL
ncbi:MAG: lipoate--protein ligase [Clostridia bacterium]|nr:lipoate--protein ligase [Clostridia bacterium]